MLEPPLDHVEPDWDGEPLHPAHWAALQEWELCAGALPPESELDWYSMPKKSMWVSERRTEGN